MDSYLGSFTVSAREDFMFGSVQSELYRHMIEMNDRDFVKGK